MASFDLRFLGTVQVSGNGEPVRGFRSRKALALLGYLAVQRSPAPREQLVDLLWESEPEKRGRANLSWVLNRLSVLLPGCLQADRHTVALQRSPEYRLDVDAFDALVARGEPEDLAAAVALYRGDFLEGMNLSGCAEFEIWLEGERERWRQRLMQALETLVAHHRRRGEHARALGFARRLLALEPWLESTHQQVMELLVRCGQRSAALAQYESCRRILAQELGVEPARETTELHERIRAATAARRSDLPAQPTPFVGREEELAQLSALLDNPDCRLVTILGPGGIGKTRLAVQAAAMKAEAFLEGVYFVPLAGASSAEYLVSAAADALRLWLSERQTPEAQLLNYLRGKQLLLILDSFEHLLEGRDLLMRILQTAPEVKLLVTSRECLNLRWEWRFEIGGLAYPSAEMSGLGDLGGYSALRLFVQMARRIEPSFSLSGDSGPVAARICRLVDGMPLGIELAAAWVEARSCDEIATEIERNLGFLETSMLDVPDRHRSLQATFEYSWRLLAPPEQSVLARLSVFRGGFGAGAASEVAGASPADLRSLADKSLLRRSKADRYEMHELLRQYAAEKLAGVPEEHAATHDRHCDYLAAFLQQQEDELVGAGAAAAVAAIKAEIEDVRAAWQWALAQRRAEAIEHGLLGLSRFYLLVGPFDEGEALIRAATERVRKLVGEKGEGAAGAQALLCRLLGERARFLNRLGRHGQAMAAAQEAADLVRRACGLEDETGLLAVSYLQWGEALMRQANPEAARPQLERALALAHSVGLRQVEGDCLSNLAGVFAQQGDSERAGSYCERALLMSREVGDPWGESRALNNLGVVARRQGDYRRAQAHYERALRIKRDIGHRQGEAIALGNLGIVLRCQGDYAGARACYEQALRIYREVGNRQGEGDVLNNLGGICTLEDDFAGARSYREQALHLHRQVGDRQGESRALGNLGSTAACQGHYATADVYLEQALRIYREVGDRRGEMQILDDLGFSFACQGAYARARPYHEQALQISREIGDQKEEGEALSHLALLSRCQGDDRQAYEYSQQALAIAREIGNPSVRASALACLGHAAEGLGQLDEAAAAYEQALALRRELGEHNRAMESLAGLARVALAQGAAEDAQARVEEILSHLEDSTLDGAVGRFGIYLTCYHILRARRDPRAEGILRAARRLLEEQAARIEDEDLRRSFLEVAAHQELVREARRVG